MPENISALSKQNRQLLRENTMIIIEAFKKDETYFVSLLKTCVHYSIFSKNDRETIQSNVTNKQKYEAFLNMLPRKGKVAEAVIKELQKKNII